MENEIGMNRRGHIATLMLVGGALILSIVALFAIISFNENFSGIEKELDYLISEYVFGERYVKRVFESSVKSAINLSDKNDFKNSFEENFIRIVNDRDLGLPVGEDFFAKVRSGIEVKESFGFFKIEILDVEIVSRSGMSEIKRKEDFVLWFDREEIVGEVNPFG